MMQHKLCFYVYSADYQRIKGVLSGNAGATLNKRYYFGDFERDITGAVTRDIHYVGADGLNCIIEKVGTNVSYYYVYKDYLGSILTVTSATGSIVDERNYDAWGKNCNPTDWTYTNIPVASLTWLTRGYTGHEHLTQFGLINMNGRLYDPILGRMLSPDNYTQGGSQGYNRYTYALNNPLKYTDPDGQNPLLIGAGVSILMNGFMNMQAGQPFFKGAIEAGAMGLIGAGWSMAIGAAAQSLAMAGVSAIKVGLFQAVAHGVTGGLMSHVQGGKFWSGAASGAVSSVIGSLTAGYGKAVQILAGGLSGGIASSIAGGNFWDGVKQGLITTGLNHALHWAQTSIQERIAAMAEKYIGRTDWAYKAQKDNISSDRWKCSKFVYDVLLEVGVDMGKPHFGRFGFTPHTAGEWGNPNLEIPGWEIVSTPLRGDIAAYSDPSYTHATGHVGIMVTNEGIGVWANMTIVRRDFVTPSNWNDTKMPIIYRRFVGFPTTLPGN
jgi:RHS repeat-associated protein